MTVSLRLKNWPPQIPPPTSRKPTADEQQRAASPSAKQIININTQTQGRHTMLIHNHSTTTTNNPIPFPTTPPNHQPPHPPHRSPSRTNLDPAIASDLRRRKRRDIADTIVERAEHLVPHEKQLILSVYADGRTAAELAPLTARTPRSLRRQLHRIIRRLTSPEFLYVIRHQTTWPATKRRVGNACFLQGQSLRVAATTLNLTLHTVRKHHQTIRAMAATTPNEKQQ